MLHLEGETPVPTPLQSATASGGGGLESFADPVLSLNRPGILGRQLSRSIVFQRQLGHSSLKASRYKVGDALKALYKETLGDEAAGIEAGVATNNEALASQANRAAVAPAACVTALQKEIQTLFVDNDTNVEWNSSIFLRADEGNLLALRAAITGASHTPYANGFFT